MPVYKAPLRDQQFVLHEVLQAVEHVRQMPPFRDLDADTVNQVLEEGGRFCSQVLQPLNLSGDEQGCRFDAATHEVRTPDGFRAAFDQLREGGWQGLTADAEYGGQGLPHVLQIAFDEMRCAANQAWTMYSGLTQGAYECLRAFGAEPQKAIFLPKLVSAEWTGTMCLTEAAYQNAAAYAKERLQGRSLAPGAKSDRAADPIIVHPDVRRALLTARAWAEGGRAFSLWLALMLDQQHHHPDASEREFAADMMALMTPVAKAFLTDNAFDGVSQCLQVFGGHGYIHESGMEQLLRDARINMIYEGTNSIQALDLLGRKVLMDAGAKLRSFGKLVQQFITEQGSSLEMNEFVTPLADLGDKVQKLTMEIGMKAMSNAEEAGAAAVSYLRVIGHLVFAYFWARMARAALDRVGAAGADPFYRAKLATARFYFQRLLPETAYHIRAARSGAKNLMELEAELF